MKVIFKLEKVQWYYSFFNFRSDFFSQTKPRAAIFYSTYFLLRSLTFQLYHQFRGCVTIDERNYHYRFSDWLLVQFTKNRQKISDIWVSASFNVTFIPDDSYWRDRVGSESTKRLTLLSRITREHPSSP